MSYNQLTVNWNLINYLMCGPQQWTLCFCSQMESLAQRKCICSIFVQNWHLMCLEWDFIFKQCILHLLCDFRVSLVIYLGGVVKLHRFVSYARKYLCYFSVVFPIRHLATSLPEIPSSLEDYDFKGVLRFWNKNTWL